MNEQQLTDRMRAAVLDEPPLGFDPDEVVGRAGRRHRQRRRAVASVAATAAVVTAAVTAIVVGLPNAQRTADDLGARPPVRTCGDVGLDGTPPETFTNPGPTIDRLNEKLPRIIDEHINGEDFRQVNEGMRVTGCEPSFFGSFQAVDGEWYVAVRLLHRHDRLTPSDDRYNDGGGVMREFTTNGSRIRMYGYPDVPGVIVAATRLDEDGFAVELTFTFNERLPVTEGEVIALVSDPELRF